MRDIVYVYILMLNFEWSSNLYFFFNFVWDGLVIIYLFEGFILYFKFSSVRFIIEIKVSDNKFF